MLEEESECEDDDPISSSQSASGSLVTQPAEYNHQPLSSVTQFCPLEWKTRPIRSEDDAYSRKHQSIFATTCTEDLNTGTNYLFYFIKFPAK
jgi:hypothetical protein